MMRIKLDENMPTGAAPLLKAHAHEADTVPDENIGGCSDDVVWRQAQSEGRFLITQDLDFSDSHRYKPGTHAGILLLRLRNPSRRAILAKIVALLASENLETWAGYLVVATDHKIRIRKS